MPKDNRLLIALGAALAVVAAVVIALLMSGGRGRDAGPPPAAQGGLTVDVADAPELSTTRELRCYVDGRFVGLATLAVCAQRNGVATDALDVGIDETGALVAAPTAAFAPPPTAPIELAETEPAPQAIESAQPEAPVVQAAAASACLRHNGTDWRTVSSSLSLNACVQALFAGTCVRPGDALYGRWSETTLRLVPRRVEQSPDNSRFTPLVDQDRRCQFPGLR